MNCIEGDEGGVTSKSRVQQLLFKTLRKWLTIDKDPRRVVTEGHNHHPATADPRTRDNVEERQRRVLVYNAYSS